jgi:hypothetical protein
MPKYVSGPGSTAQKPPPKPKQNQSFDRTPGRVEPEPVKPRFAGPDEPPDPVLKRAGFTGGIQAFNQHVDAISQAHQQTFGYKPPPGLTLDIARSGVSLVDYPKLFPAVNARTYHLDTVVQQRKQDADQFLEGYQQAKVAGAAEKMKWLHQNEQQLHDYMQDPEFKAKFAKAYIQGEDDYVQRQVASFFPTPLSGALREGAKDFTQVVTGLTVGPALAAVAEGQAGYKDVKAISRGELPTSLVKTNVKMGKMAVKGVIQDVRHPRENLGYLSLDLFAAVTGGAGVVTRVGRAATAGSAREAATALIRRPTSGTVTLRKGGHTEEALLSENQLVAGVQRVVAAQKNRRMQQRFEASDMPGGLGPTARLWRSNQVLDKMLDPSTSPFSGEASLRREMQARKRTENILLMEPKRELERAAGWSVTAAPILDKVFNKLPEQVRGGLTIGEQKALQVVTLDDPTPLQTWRDFHKKMIDWEIGDPASHRAQLHALKLAEKALENPSKRFKEALAATYEAIDRQEQIKIRDLGLDPDTADRRVIAYGEVVRTGKRTSELEIPAERQVASSLYLPSFVKGKGPRKVSERGPFFEMRESGYGYTPGRDLPEMKHEFTGDSIRSGDFRIDTTNLIGEAYARTVRLATVRNDHKRLWSASTETPRSPFDRPIRDTTDVPPRLKEVLEEIEQGQVTGKDVADLHPGTVDDLFKFLYPGKQLDNGRWVITEPIDNVRWVSKQHLESFRPPLRTKAKLAGQIINEPFRDITLFARLAYALNAVSNVGIMLFHQGHHTVPNLTKAIMSRQLHGDKVTDALDALVGQSKSRSFAPDFDHALLKAGRAAASVWNKVADQVFRRGAILYELERKGFKGKDLEKALFDPKNFDAVNEAKRRANKAMVEFDNLTWYEREVLRNYIFVYPWVSRSLVWSLRSIIEHPIKSDILAQIGQQEMQEHPEVFNKVPDWFKKTGYVPVGFTADGHPKVVNATSINVFSTLQQMVSLGSALTVGDPSGFNNAAQLGGPATTFGLHAVTGRDDYGNAYQDSPVLGAAKDLITVLPQAAAYARATKTNPAEKPIDLTNRNTLSEREHAALHRSVFSPGWLGGYGSLIAGGMVAREVDPDALAARYWAEQPPAARHQHEMTLVRKALGMQADLLKEELPAGVKTAVNLGGAMTWAYQQQTRKLGRTPTPKEQAATDIDVFLKKHRLSDSEASKLSAKLGKLSDPTEISRFKDFVVNKYGNAQALREWDSDVRAVASFKKETLEAKMSILRSMGLTDMHTTPGTQDELYAAGRKYLSYLRAAREKVKALDNDPDSTLHEAALRLWQDEQDQPITINGKRVAPSPVRLEWAKQTSKEKQTHIAGLLNRDWGAISNFDKELVGPKLPISVSTAWARLADVKHEYQKANPGSNVTADQLLSAVKQMERYPEYKGILKDYLFSVKPKIRRLELLKPYQNMDPTVRSQFDSGIGTNAKVIATALSSGVYPKGELKDVWKNYVAKSLLPWLQQPEQKNLWAWVDAHGGTSFLNTLPD